MAMLQRSSLESGPISISLRSRNSTSEGCDAVGLTTDAAPISACSNSISLASIAIDDGGSEIIGAGSSLPPLAFSILSFPPFGKLIGGHIGGDDPPNLQPFTFGIRERKPLP